MTVPDVSRDHRHYADADGGCGLDGSGIDEGPAALLPLTEGPEARAAWPNKHLIQISEAMTARAIRTQDWTYCVINVQGRKSLKFSDRYVENQMYSQMDGPVLSR